VLLDDSMGASDAVTLVAVGDISLGDHPLCVGRGVRSRLRRSEYTHPAYPFTHVADALGAADLVFGNLETVLSGAGLTEGLLTSVEMRGDRTSARRLGRAGFNVLNVANNHILQHGRSAFVDTLEALNEAGISPVGLNGADDASCVPVTRDVRGLPVTFLAYAFEPDQYYKGIPLYAFGPVCAIAGEIRAARSRSAIVICSVHWGEEFIRYPSRQMMETGRALIDAGAHVVLGHHPHVFQGIERYGHGLIAYSLGNFVFDMLWSDALRIGLVLRLTLSPAGVEDVGVSFVKIAADYQPRPVSAEASQPLHEQLAQLTTVLASSPSDERYRREYARLVGLNRRQSYGHFLLNSLRYPPGLWFQIIGRSIRRTIEQTEDRVSDDLDPRTARLK